MKLIRGLAVFSLLAGVSLFAQATKGAWWNGKVVKELNLSPEQTRQMRATMRQYRSRLQELREAVQRAEMKLEDAFNSDPVDQQKANDDIERLIAARADLTRSISQMGLKLRTVLTAQQWQEVEKLFPPKTPGT